MMSVNNNFRKKYSVDELLLIESVMDFSKGENSLQPVAVDLSVIRSLRSRRNMGRLWRARNTKDLAEDLVYSHDPEFFFTTIPNRIRNIILLHELDMSGNRVQKVPSWIKEFASLRGLYLEGNDMSQWEPVIGSLDNLRALNLSANRIALPYDAFIENLELRELDLSGCNYKRINIDLRYNFNLVSLDLSENFLSEFPQDVMDLRALRDLKLNFNHISYIHPNIGYMYQLENLDLSNNRLTELPQELMYLPNLKRVSLWNNSFSSAEIDRIKNQMGDIALFKPK